MMATALVYPNKTLKIWGEYSLSFIDFNLKANKLLSCSKGLFAVMNDTMV